MMYAIEYQDLSTGDEAWHRSAERYLNHTDANGAIRGMIALGGARASRAYRVVPVRPSAPNHPELANLVTRLRNDGEVVAFWSGDDGEEAILVDEEIFAAIPGSPVRRGLRISGAIEVAVRRLLAWDVAALRELAESRARERAAADAREQAALREQEVAAALERERVAAEERARAVAAERERLERERIERERAAALERERKAAQERERQRVDEERERAAAAERERKAAQERERQRIERERAAAAENARRAALEEERRRVAQEREQAAEAERAQVAAQERERQRIEQERQRAAAERERKATQERERAVAAERERMAAQERERQRAERERARAAAEERERNAAAERERVRRERERELAAQRQRDADHAKSVEALSRKVDTVLAQVKSLGVGTTSAIAATRPASNDVAETPGTKIATVPPDSDGADLADLARLLQCGPWPAAKRANDLLSSADLPPGAKAALRALAGDESPRAIGNALKRFSNTRIEGIPTRLVRRIDGHGYARWQVVDDANESHARDPSKPCKAGLLRGALTGMGFRSAQAESAIAQLGARVEAEPLADLVREALGLVSQRPMSDRGKTSGRSR